MKATVFFGARSFEHEVSIVSAIVLRDVLALDFVFIDKMGEMYAIAPENMQAKTFASGAYKNAPKLTLTQGGLLQKGRLLSHFVPVSLALNLVHGAEGEDGKLAALFEFFNIPYIGPRLEASILSYNKELTKLYAQSRNVPTLPYSVIRRGDSVAEPVPFILKPLHLGSSIGISVVKDTKELDYALDVAFEFDDAILLEPFKQGIKEYNLAGCYAQGAWHLSIIEEPQKGEILDFDKKYLDFSRRDSVQKAQISPELEATIIQNFQKIYTNCFEGALIRCDFFVQDDCVYLNEINPVPGSLAHYLFADFRAVFAALGSSLPKVRHVPIQYLFINQIRNAKGK